MPIAGLRAAVVALIATSLIVIKCSGQSEIAKRLTACSAHEVDHHVDAEFLIPSRTLKPFETEGTLRADVSRQLLRRWIFVACVYLGSIRLCEPQSLVAIPRDTTH